MEKPSAGRGWGAGYLFPVSLGLLLAAGCAPQSRPPVQAAKPVTGNERLLLTLTPAVPRALDVTLFTVHVMGKDSRPVINAQATAALSMPGMQMPPNALSFTPSTPGAYTGQGRFSMPGQWAVTVTVLDKGRRTAATFPITVR